MEKAIYITSILPTDTGVPTRSVYSGGGVRRIRPVVGIHKFNFKLILILN